MRSFPGILILSGSRICPVFVLNFGQSIFNDEKKVFWALSGYFHDVFRTFSGHCPENVQKLYITIVNFSRTYSLIPAEFITKFQSNLEFKLFNFSRTYSLIPAEFITKFQSNLKFKLFNFSRIRN